MAIAPASRGSTWLPIRSEEHTSELQSRLHLVCRLLLEKKNSIVQPHASTRTHGLVGIIAASNREEGANASNEYITSSKWNTSSEAVSDATSRHARHSRR